ncbi:Fic family protein [Streptomyces sp. NPDC097619]|uniref:Fic family protein n=1 Tax=Streptomyces sp. NPDC097619 TaxID=3157228 RepID=UPI00332352A7
MTAAVADSLSIWLRVRREADWRGAPDLRPLPVDRDGFRCWCAGPVRRRDPVRAERLLAAYASAREDAALRAPLDFALLAGWQCRVLGTPEAPFRRGDAYAKGGRERYGLTPRTRAAFESCLRAATDPDLPAAARAARAALDVAFFHPFADGNARASLLVLVHVLAREGIVLPEVGPLLTTRYADDPAGAADLALLIGLLHRGRTGPHRRRPGAADQVPARSPSP